MSSLLAIAVASHTGIASAELPPDDVESAKSFYNQGLDLREAGDHVGAMTFFRVAFARVRSPIVGLDLAREHVALGDLVAALTIAESIDKIPVAPEETDKSATARADALRLTSELQKRVATLEVVAPADALIVLDGARMTSVEIARRRVNPGKHTVLVSTTTVASHDIELKEGELRKIVVESKPAPAPIAPISREPAAKHSYTLTYTGLGVATVGLVAGTITGILALSRADSLHDRCSNTSCPGDVGDDVHTVRALGTTSTISFAVAGGGLLLAAFGYVRERSVTPVVGLGTIGLTGTF